MAHQVIEVIQRQVPIGSQVTFSLRNGDKVSGMLVELGRNHVTVENNGTPTTILIDMIGAWQVQGKVSSEENPTESATPDDKDAPTNLASDAQAPRQRETRTTSPSVEPELLKKLLEIEARFQVQLQAAKIEIKPPDFSLPAEEFKGPRKTEATTVWNRLRSRYEYAAKVNELSAKFGRIQPILSELKTLSEWFPASTGVKRHLAFFYFLAGHRQEAIKCYQETALAAQEAPDWYNVAALALQIGQEELACYGLEQFFHRTPITRAMSTWYVYVRLLMKFSNYSALATLCKSKEGGLSQDEANLVLETSVYLLKVSGQDQAAADMTREWLAGQPPIPLILTALEQFTLQPSESYQKLVSSLTEQKEPAKKPSAGEQQMQPQGFIYELSQNFGFLRGADNEKYFFHRSALVDDDLLKRVVDVRRGQKIPVVFEVAQGPKGPIAVKIYLHRTPDEIFKRASEYADDGEYHKAIHYLKRLLDIDSAYPRAQELYEKWRDYSRATGVPKGSGPFARAKRVQLIEKDLDKAAQLLRQAIVHGDNAESAVKDLANLLAQQGRPQEAVEVLTRYRQKVKDQQSVDNMLVGFYQNAGQYDQALALLQAKLAQATTDEKKIQILWQMANCYLKQESFSEAEEQFRAVLKHQPDSKAAQRNLAICLFKQGRYGEAEEILNRLLTTSPDARAAELLEAVRQAEVGGEPARIGEIIIETTLSDFSREISGFTQFFLNRCDFQGVPPDRIQMKSFDRSDIGKLEELATQLGTSRPRERAGYYLSAANIVSILQEGENLNQFYRYLYRSFASSGDATVVESRPLDAAREYYCEALSIYDGCRSQSRHERDAVNALVRFLFSTLGQAEIPMTPKVPSLDETIENVLNRHPYRDKVFDAIAYLLFRSRYAANRVLNCLYNKSSLQAMALEYLKTKGISVAKPIRGLDDFVHLWNGLLRKHSDVFRLVTNELRFLVKVEFTTASLENAIEHAKALVDRLCFDLDQQRVMQLQRILEVALDLCKQSTFEEKERLCMQIDSRCQDLLREIEDSPTKLSVEEFYPVIEAIRTKATLKLKELYQSSTPQVSLRLPVESYSPDNYQRIEVQIVVENRIGCSPAEALELIVQEDREFFSLLAGDIRLDSSLRGGEQQILKVPIRVNDQALRSQTFSLPVYAQYRTRSEEVAQTLVNNFSIRLYSEEEFEEIENPYAAYAEGGIVGDPEMFYGREELIENVARAIRESRTQSKCVVIFGQKRAGKSSILHHLKTKLQASDDLLILDLGNIGSLLNEHSSTPLLYQILWSILEKLGCAVEDRIPQGHSPLDLHLPADREFYEHPSPLGFFKTVFEQYRRSAAKLEDWRRFRLVVLIDEFSYIYTQIVGGRIPETFMKNWKALLQENYFSAVLVGQDVMPKFKQRFPNEFGTSQDERVSYLKREDAIKLIDEPIRLGGRQGESRYREKAIERILNLTAGSPFYIQILCNRLVEYMNRRRARLVTEADVEQVKNELIRGVNALGIDKFENLVNSGDTSDDAIDDRDILQVLTAIAVNSQTGLCSRNSIACETRTPINVILEDLVKRDVIECQRGQYYSIRVGLFRDWLIAHRGGGR